MRKVPKTVTADEAVSVVKSGDLIYLSGFANTPETLLDALCRRADRHEFENVRILQLMTFGPAPYMEEKYAGIFVNDLFFVGENNRRAVRAGFADYLPVGLSDTQNLFRTGRLKCDVAMIKVTPPDRHGYVSLGVSVDITLSAVMTAKKVIAIIDSSSPRTLGDALIPYSKIDYAVIATHPLPEVLYPPSGPLDITIGRNCAELIEDGACLQMGIGSIPNAILSQLGGHRDLGIHTEMFADGVLGLVEKGVITGRNKVTDKGKLVSTFLMGSQKVYDFIDDNPMVAMMDVGYTNDPYIISRNPKMTAINSAVQIDLTGQVCADSIGTKFYSGTGGQVDFIYGASLSEGGKAIIAMPSCTRNGISKIAPTVMEGAGIVTSRAHVHWVVTEYGAVDLYGRSMQERAKLLIGIAHPDHREELDRAAFERFGPHYHSF